MEFLQEVMKAALDRVKDELLLFAVIIIVLILLFPESWFVIFITGFVFALIYSGIKIKTTKSNTDNPDFIAQQDWPIVKQRITENLAIDDEKLDRLVPLLKDRTHERPVDEIHKINSSLIPLQDRMLHLNLTARSKIDNENEIELLRTWFEARHTLNRQLSLRARADYIDENEDQIRTTLTNLIEFYEQCP